jgi:hypothetical protein
LTVEAGRYVARGMVAEQAVVSALEEMLIRRGINAAEWQVAWRWGVAKAREREATEMT